jgi:predicted RNA-binding Zn-ribbon protein involved in translation (DUF1610 family)
MLRPLKRFISTNEACSNCGYKKPGNSPVECPYCGELQSQSEEENIDLFVCGNCGNTW